MNELRIVHEDFERLRAHLFPGDHDEHGALLLAGAHTRRDGGTLLTVRELHLLGKEEFPPGKRGYRQFAAQALSRIANRGEQERLALVTAHSHPGSKERTGLSPDDLAGHERLFEHLLDITGAQSVAGVAFGEHSAAGELWDETHQRSRLDRVRVIGANIELLYPEPPAAEATGERFDRQVRLFGDIGQTRLRGLHVAVIGAGGGGSILVEQLAHLGVGELTIIDHDVVKTHNLSRIIGATERDAREQTKKVTVARRNVARIDPSIVVHAIDGDVSSSNVAQAVLDSDQLFLATDTATARLVANAIAQSFLIPLIQIGAKVDTNKLGEIEQIYTAVRPVLGRRGCLQCAGLIDPDQLAWEASSPQERANQDYLGTGEVIDPSVTTLNAEAAAGALNVFLMGTIGQAAAELAEHRITLTRDGTTLRPQIASDPDCRWSGIVPSSHYARADLSLLPCRPAPGTASVQRISLLQRVRRRLKWRRGP
jgi:ThiF family